MNVPILQIVEEIVTVVRVIPQVPPFDKNCTDRSCARSPDLGNACRNDEARVSRMCAATCWVTLFRRAGRPPWRMFRDVHDSSVQAWLEDPIKDAINMKFAKQGT